ncbi:MAG: hypothetical protein AAGJ31_14095, partial [Verrucomicrobiota bacterium]
LVDRNSKDTFVVSGDRNDQGWRLEGVTPGGDLASLTAKISISGGEMVTLQFDPQQWRPKPRQSDGVEIPKGKEWRPKPTDEEKRKWGEWARKRMSKLSEDQRKQVGNIMKEKMEANPQLSDRQKGEVFVQILEYVEKGGN